MAPEYLSGASLLGIRGKDTAASFPIRRHIRLLRSSLIVSDAVRRLDKQLLSGALRGCPRNSWQVQIQLFPSTIVAGVIFGFFIGAAMFFRDLVREQRKYYAAVICRGLQGKTGSARAMRFSSQSNILHINQTIFQ